MRLLRIISFSETKHCVSEDLLSKSMAKVKMSLQEKANFLRKKLNLCSIRGADLPKWFLLTARDLRRLLFMLRTLAVN